MPDKTQDRVLIVDFGSQVTQLIARRVREAGVYSEIVPYNKAEDALAEERPSAIILSGGPASVHETGTPQAPQAVFERACRCWASAMASRPWWPRSAARSRADTTASSAAPMIKSIDETPLFDGVLAEGGGRKCG